MRPLRNFDRVAEIYDATRGFPPAAEAAVGDGIAAILAPLGEHPSLVEVGVGTGRVAVPLALRGVRVTGADISRGMVAVLRRRAPGVAVVLAEAARLPFRPEAFDAVLFVHILHLVPDPAATVREALRVLRPGGLAIACDTSHTRTATSASSEAVRRIAREVAGEHARHMPVPNLLSTVTFREAASAAGLGFEERVLATWVEEETARDVLGDLSGQVNSHSWDIPADLLPEVVARATPEVTALMGGLDTPVRSTTTFRATVARKA